MGAETTVSGAQMLLGLGIMMGQMFEISGVSIPIFCDSGFVILSPKYFHVKR